MGWEVPQPAWACKLGKPEHQVVGVVGDSTPSSFSWETWPLRVQNNVPYVMVMLNNGYP